MKPAVILHETRTVDVLAPRSLGQLTGGNQGIFLDRKGIQSHVPADKKGTAHCCLVTLSDCVFC